MDDQHSRLIREQNKRMIEENNGGSFTGRRPFAMVMNKYGDLESPLTSRPPRYGRRRRPGGCGIPPGSWVPCPSMNSGDQRPQSGKRFCELSQSDQTGGLIAQKCSPGFYREWSGPRRGQCVPCSCNGLSDQCDEHTGKCVNCRFHSAGDHCERCQEGYHGDAAQKTCRPCPCPFMWNNQALACLHIGSGVVECLCKRGYAGSRCERCAFGYYGDPAVHGGSCKPCECDRGGDGNICHSPTGECISPGNNSCEDHFHTLKCCTEALLLRLRANEGDLRGITHISLPVSMPIHPEGIVFDAERGMKTYSGARRQLELKAEQLEEDVNTIRDDLDHLIHKAHQMSSRVNDALQSRKGPKIKAKVVLGHAESVLASLRDLIKRPSQAADAIRLEGRDKATVMEGADRLVEEMSRRVCVEATTRGQSRGRMMKMAKKLLVAITKMAAVRPNQQTLNQTADSVRASQELLGHMSDLLSGAKVAVQRARRFHLRSASTMRHLQHGHDQTTAKARSLPAVTESTRTRWLENISTIFFELQDGKKGFEKDAARLDGAKQQLRERINAIYHLPAKIKVIAEAEEHARELGRSAARMQITLPAADGTKRPSQPGALSDIATDIEQAAMAAHLSHAAADKAFKDVERSGLRLTTGALRDNSTRLWTAANHTQNDFRKLSHSLNAHKDRMKRRRDKGEALRFDISSVSDEIKSLQKDDVDVLIESAKREASATNDTVTQVTYRLTNMKQEMDRLTLNNSALAFENVFNDIQHAVTTLDWELPVVREKLAQVEAMGKRLPTRGNMTENISRIKDLVQETRSYLNRLSLATRFTGTGHIELHPPSDAEDAKAFAAVDLLLSVEKRPAEHRRKRQDKWRDDNMFVLYLGADDASGDYIGMAIRRGVLICVYKLHGHVHEVAAGPITTFTGVHASALDRVVFHRVYHDAEVNITANFTSEQPIPYAPKRHLPNTMSSILDLDPQRTVFYVGGYPQHFTPPEELRYPGYRGYVKLLYFNDQPLCLSNNKRAVNMEAGVHALMLPRAEVSHFYRGSGYRQALVKEPHDRRRRIFKLHTNSRETDALLFYMGTEEAFWCLLVEQGHLVLQGQYAGMKERARRNDKVSLFDKHFVITIDDTITVHYEDKHISIKHVHTPFESFYIGGVPQHIRTRHDISTPPLRGCVAHVSVDGQMVEYNATVGVSDACPFGLLGVRTATLHSPLSADWLFAPDQQRLALGFRSKHKHGVILWSDSQSPSLGHISLADGFLQLSLGHHNLISAERYDDGRWHYMCVAQTPRLEVQVDNRDIALHTFKREPEVIQGEEFKGCITNLYSRTAQSFTPVDLSSLPPTGGVGLGHCRLSSPTQTGRSPTDVSRQLQMLRETAEQTDDECARQRVPRRGYEFSQRDSWLAYKLPQQDLNYRPHFSLYVKTKSSKGLILFVEGTGPVPLLALYVTNGKIKMSLGPSRVIHHKLKTNDGHWHRVECSVERNTFHLLVDGFRVTDGHLPHEEGSSLNFHDRVYLGGHPGSTEGPTILLKSISGCVRDFRMNNQPVGKPEGARGVSPCSDGLTERGAYFDGGHVVLLDDSFAVGDHFALTFELRPRRLTGLLFHARGHEISFDVFLINNTVGVTVNDGGGSVSVALTPQNLCDGEFHVITVSTGQKDLTLMVDAASEKKAGSFASFPSSMTQALLHIGGATDSRGAPLTSPYIGCLRNVIINGRHVAFETRVVRVVGLVDVKECPAH